MYHAALSYLLPSGTVKFSILKNVLTCIAEVGNEVDLLQVQLQCVERCMFYIKRDYESRDSIKFHHCHASILLELMGCKSTDDVDFILYYGLLRKCISHIDSQDSKSEYQKMMEKAEMMYNE